MIMVKAKEVTASGVERLSAKEDKSPSNDSGRIGSDL
jgi:hypothetical protein